MEFKNDVEALDGLRDKFSELKKEITRVIYGQDEIITQV
jgi:MoxR-like ATPase